MKNIIFVDLDETLIHTVETWYGETEYPDCVEVIIDNQPYKTSLRNGALEFLQKLRQRGDVYMLTAATKDYAIAMNKQFDLGFDVDQIYAREDISAGNADVAYFCIGKGTVYLFDNLPRHENRSKIVFLRPLGDVKYVQVPAFYNNATAAFEQSTIKYLIANIS